MLAVLGIGFFEWLFIGSVVAAVMAAVVTIVLAGVFGQQRRP